MRVEDIITFLENDMAHLLKTAEREDVPEKTKLLLQKTAGAERLVISRLHWAMRKKQQT